MLFVRTVRYFKHNFLMEHVTKVMRATYTCWDNRIPIMFLLDKGRKTCVAVLMFNPDYLAKMPRGMSHQRWLKRGFDLRVPSRWEHYVMFGRVRNPLECFAHRLVGLEYKERVHTELAYMEFGIDTTYYRRCIERTKDVTYPVLYVELAAVDYSMRALERLYLFYVCRKLEATRPGVQFEMSEAVPYVAGVTKVGSW